MKRYRLLALLLTLALLLPSCLDQYPSPPVATTESAPVSEEDFQPHRIQVPFPLTPQYGSITNPLPFYGWFYEPAPNPKCTAILAEVVQTLPDLYHVIKPQYEYKKSEGLDHRIHLVKVLDTANDNLVPQYIYIMTDLAMSERMKPDRVLLLRDLYPYAHEGSALYNKDDGCAEIFDCAIYRVSDPYYAKHSLSVYEPDDERIRTDFDAVEALYLDHPEGYGTPAIGVDLPPLSEHSDESIRDTLAYIKAAKSGLFLQTLIASGTYSHGNYEAATFTRHLNGYPTAESYSLLLTEGKVQSSGITFTDEELSALPDLTPHRKEVLDRIESGTLTPPHIVGYEDLRSLGYGIHGMYTKLDGKAVGIIRVVWHFDPIEDVPESYYGYQLDDCYFVVENGTLTPITDTELYKRGGNPASFIVGKIGKYSQYGKTYTPSFP